MVIAKNNIWLGMGLAMLSPIVTLYAYRSLRFTGVDFSLFLELLLTDRSFVREVASAYLMLNGFLFFAYVYNNKMHTGYGVFITTLILGLATFFINVIWGG